MSNEQQQGATRADSNQVPEGGIQVETLEEIGRQEKEEARIAYQENRKTEMAMIKIGQRDASNNEITKVYVEASEYFIYEISTANASESLRIYIHTVEEEDTTGIIEHYNDILPCIGSARDDIVSSSLLAASITGLLFLSRFYTDQQSRSKLLCVL